ncbi:RNA polymerase sigma factor [Kribbella deserti]|uniref:RNA polymerase sigma factor n=1 Tax=Kribbella deserti TaxID=1926257 RepID=A0ABV6QUW2_9ACTN
MREYVDQEFAVYVDTRQDRWLRGATLVCLDPVKAGSALQAALARLAMRWGREDDPDAYALRLLYERIVRRRLPWQQETAAAPGEVLRALGTLTPLQRAVLVLVAYEELTVVETGDLLDISHIAVREQLQAGLSRLQAELGTSSSRLPDVRITLDQAVDGILSPGLADDAWAAGAAIGRRRRRTGFWLSVAVVAAAAISLLLIGLAQ